MRRVVAKSKLVKPTMHNYVRHTLKVIERHRERKRGIRRQRERNRKTEREKKKESNRDTVREKGQ